MVIRGRVFLFCFLGALVTLGTGSYFGFRYLTRHRFAIGLYPLGETPDIKPRRRVAFFASGPADPVPRHIPLSVRIEKNSAGHSSLQAVAYLFSERGELIYAPQALQIAHDRVGKPIEETVFEPLGNRFVGNAVWLVVIRVPSFDGAIQDNIMQQLNATSPSGRDRGARLMMISRQLQGWAELLTTSVPPV